MPSTIPERVGADVRIRLERAWIASVGFLTVLGVLAPGGVKADIVQDFINYILLAIAYVLQWILIFMGKLVLLITNVVVDVAQYNSFVNAAPVNAGWPLVRDVVNMFFIVVLLITAFSTIVQWKKFDYRKILPKLLLMAVLVNFSRQLIGLLIDFSQILMLTFVNGFKAAAAGNFVKALKLDRIMSIDPTSLPQNQGKAQEQGLENKDSLLLKIVLSEFLGIFFMGTTIVMLLIMLIYLIVRVVGLWIALIFSPAALFVTALAGTPIASKVSLVGDKYWSRLGAMLSGGPIMAFFLWLTLSTVQGGDIAGFTVQAPAGEDTVSYFSGAIGNAQDVATYFVALIMLLMGVEAAVAVSNEIGSSVLSGAAGKIRTGGMAATRFAAYGGLAAAGGYAARGAGRVAGGAARAAERRLELRDRLGRGLQGVAARGGVLGTVAAGVGAGAAGAALRRSRGAERAEAAKRVEAGTFGMDTAQRMQYLTNKAGGLTDSGREAGVMLSKLQTTPAGGLAITSQVDKEGVAKGLTGAALAAYTQRETLSRQGDALRTLEGTAKARGDQDLLKYITEQKLSRPDMLKGDDFTKAMDGLASMDSKTLARSVSPQAFQNADVADLIIKRAMKDGQLDQDSTEYQQFMKGNDTRAQLLKQRYEEMKTAATAGNQPLTNSGVEAAMAATAGSYMSRVVTGEGASRSVSYVTQSAADFEAQRTGNADWEKPQRRESEIAAAKDRLARARAEGAAPAQMAEVQQGMMAAGAPMTEAYAVDASGKFASEADRASFQSTVQNIQGGKLSMDVVQNMDFDLLQQNPSGRNEARSVFVEQMTTEGMGKMARDATSSQNKAAQSRVTQMAQVVDMEGSRAEKTVAQANTKLAQKMSVGQLAGEYEKAKKSGDMTGFQTQLDAIEAESGVKITQADVGAISKRQDMSLDPTIQAYRREPSSRTANVLRRAGRSVAQGGAAVGGTVAAAARRVATSEGRTAARMARDVAAPAVEPPMSAENTEARRRANANRGPRPTRGTPPATPPPATPPPPPAGGQPTGGL